jgi:hypothetical protein
MFTSDRKAANFNVAVLIHGQPSLFLKQTSSGNATAVSYSTILQPQTKACAADWRSAWLALVL